MSTLNPMNAVSIAEGWIEADDDTFIAAWQYLIDSGLAWKLQGWFGRTASDLIGQGICREPHESRQTQEAA